MLPRRLFVPLRRHIARVRVLQQEDLAQGFGEVWLPAALARKYPSAAREWAWQYVFPAERRALDPRSGDVRRHHLSDQSFQRAMRKALRASGIAKPATSTAAHAPSRARSIIWLRAWTVRNVEAVVRHVRALHTGARA